MADCKRCGRDSEDQKTITYLPQSIEYQDGISFRRLPYPEDGKERCSVCHVMPGGIHHEGCYMERCPQVWKEVDILRVNSSRWTIRDRAFRTPAKQTSGSLEKMDNYELKQSAIEGQLTQGTKQLEISILPVVYIVIL